MPIQNFYVAPTSTPYNPNSLWKISSINANVFIPNTGAQSSYTHPAYYPSLNKAFIFTEGGVAYKINLTNNTKSDISMPYTGRAAAIIPTTNYVYIFYLSSTSNPRAYYAVYRFDPVAETFSTITTSTTAYDTSYFGNHQSSTSYYWRLDPRVTWWDGGNIIYVGHSWTQYGESFFALAKWSISGNGWVNPNPGSTASVRIYSPNNDIADTSNVRMFDKIFPITDTGGNTSDTHVVAYPPMMPSIGTSYKMFDKFSLSAAFNLNPSQGTDRYSYIGLAHAGTNFSDVGKSPYYQVQQRPYQTTQGPVSCIYAGPIDENNILYADYSGQYQIFNLMTKTSYGAGGIAFANQWQSGNSGVGIHYDPRITGTKVFSFTNYNGTVYANNTSYGSGLHFAVNTIGGI